MKSQSRESELKDHKIIDFTAIKQLYKRYIYRYKRYVLISFFLMALIALLTSSIAYLIKPVINKVFLEKQGNKLYIISFCLISIISLKTIATYLQHVTIHFIHERVMMDIREAMFKKIIKMPMMSIHKLKNGQFMTYFMNDIQLIGDSLSTIFISSVRELLTILCLIILVFYQDILLASIALFIFPAAFIPLAKLSKSLRRRYSRTQKYYDILTSKLTDTLHGIKTIKAYNAEHLETRSFKKILINIFKMSLSFKRKGSIGSPMMEFVAGISIVLVIIYGGNQVIQNKSNAGSFFSFMTALIMAYKPAKALSGINVKAQTCSVSLHRIFTFLDSHITEDFSDGKVLSFEKPTIKFENVEFDYSLDKENDSTLKDINVEIKPHSKVAFVGSSGSGKSTIINLLLRLYEISSGKVTINNVDIRDMSLANLRRNIAYISQDSFLFDDTIKSNITYSARKKDLTQKAINDALEIAQINFLDTLANGADEYVGYGGVRLSLGQKQRVAIARAFLKDAPIIVLDEATSALDVITEKAIKDVIFNKMKDKTIIMVAHRLSTVTDCDRIYVMDKGKIVEYGNHKELLEQKGLYYKLWLTSSNQT
jgi:subfamily B ATP-binding cassette protein MsbA